MAVEYTTAAGDMIDLICFRHYRSDHPGAVEAVLTANIRINLSDYPPKLPRGLVIVLPDLGADQASIARTTLIKLWD